ncbi:MAG: FtsX-like permease family protein, partial [Saprospiraceae bacterium]|nr:FtsX-like permease family protein [Saprospiraceae bacterium]
GHDHAEGEEHDHDHEGHDHNSIAKPLIEEADDKDITSLLIKFKGRNFQALNMGRNINDNTDLQAATPAIEINRVFAQMAQGERVLRILGVVIVIVSALSIFISLYSSLKERQYELALMRVMGASPGKLFFLIVLEGLLLAGIGYVLGIVMSHVSMGMIANFMQDSYRYSFSGLEFLQEEYFLLLGALIIGFLAALIPALRASKTPIAETLTKG